MEDDHRAIASGGAAVSERPHGLRRYQTDRCRCFTCRIAKHRYRERSEAGLVDGYVDAEPVREHVLALQALGWGQRRLERAAGVSRDVIKRLPVVATVQRKVAVGLLAVPIGPPPPPPRYTSTLGTHRRINALTALGWSRAVLADRAGMRDTHMSRLMANPTLEPRNAAKFRAVYDELSMQIPAETQWTARVRERSRRACHFPPLAWDDETLDDPDALPCLLPPVEPVDRDLELLVQHVFAGHPVEPTTAAKREIVRRMPDRQAKDIAGFARCTVKNVGYVRSTLEAS